MLDRVQRRAGVAHDVKGFLVRAGLALEILQRDNCKQVRKHADRISRALEQLSELCLRELDPDKQWSPDLEIFDASETKRFLREVICIAQMNDDNFAAKVDFRLLVDPTISVQAHRQTLFRAIFNLLVNAVNAIIGSKGSRILINVYPHETMVRFDIIDNGPGLPDKVLNTLFPFSSTDTPRRGKIGLGLVTACNLANEMNGSLSLLRSGTNGTVFRFEFPAAVNAGTVQVGPKTNQTDRLSPSAVCGISPVPVPL